jgi:hypothetical protein
MNLFTIFVRFKKNCGSSSGVEHQLPKLRVEGSNPFSRSNKKAVQQPFCNLSIPTNVYIEEVWINYKNSRVAAFYLIASPLGTASCKRANPFCINIIRRVAAFYLIASPWERRAASEPIYHESFSKF